MKKSFQSPYFKWGLTAFLVVFFSICFFFSIFKMSGLFSAIKTFMGILKPFIYGAVLAYFVLPAYNLLVKKSFPYIKRFLNQNKKLFHGQKCFVV